MSRMQCSVLQKWISATSDLLFPPTCIVCSTAGGVVKGAICDKCLKSVEFIESPMCPVCGREFSDSASGDHLCGSCLRKSPFFSEASAVAHYQEPMATLLHSLKYQGDMAVLPALQTIVALCPAISLKGNERIIPVPLHIKRLRQRGFNQAVLIAELFFPEHKDLFLVDSQERIRHTSSQTGLDGAERRRNLHGAFGVRNNIALQGKKVILVDDVYTTGSTANECSRALLAAGAHSVSVLTLARVKE